MQIVSLLQIEPEIGTVSAQLAEPQRHAGGDRLLFLQGRHTERDTPRRILDLL